jgi:hypothetical protein
MPKQLVLDHTGHSTHVFDKANTVSLEEAERRFKDLTGKGFLAATRPDDGSPGQALKAFDPDAETTVFIPPLQGG